jgi:glycine dehydrogenase subunit 1
VTRYTAITHADLKAMLAAIGVASVEELFARQVPEAVRLRRDLDLPPGMAEQQVYALLRGLAQRNASTEDEVSFLGAGMYDHYVPALIDMLCERSEFLTPYTPYQPEVSQGGLQVMFEYQTAVSELTGLPVANASVYEGPSAVAQAAYMARLRHGPGRLVASAGLHPHTLQTLRTHARGFGCEVVEVPLDPDGSGRTGLAAWRAAVAGEAPFASGEAPIAAIFAQPSFYGVVEDAPALCAAAKEAAAQAPRGAVGRADAAPLREAGPSRRAGDGPDACQPSAAAPGAPPLVIAQVDPITLGILRPPGACGVDVAVGEGQPLGGRLDFGGPSFGFFAARSELLRAMPGRIAGETRDADGRRGFVLTLQTREQHIRRERATSNICTAQALNALAGLVYLVWLGRHGIVELGRLLLARTQYARQALCAIPGVAPLHAGPVVRELALRLDADVGRVRRRCLAEGVNPGADLEALTGRPEDRGGLLVAITERRSRADIDRLAALLRAALPAARAPRPAAQPADGPLPRAAGEEPEEEQPRLSDPQPHGLPRAGAGGGALARAGHTHASAPRRRP